VTVVLDASAVLVLLLDEPGAEDVAGVLADGALSTVNLAEVRSKLFDRGVDAVGLGDHLTAAGVTVYPMTERDAAEVAELRRIDTARVLSLGDRCCLALARRLSAVVVTADRVWSDVDAGIEVQQVR
jgi:ribonuclease VapC